MASCSPVEAPLGTAPRPKPLVVLTSASTVGLPRESRISRALTSRISVMVRAGYHGRSGRSTARLEQDFDAAILLPTLFRRVRVRRTKLGETRRAEPLPRDLAALLEK